MSASQAFCRSVATFRARTWKDALPLVDLLRSAVASGHNRLATLFREHPASHLMRRFREEVSL